MTDNRFKEAVERERGEEIGFDTGLTSFPTKSSEPSDGSKSKCAGFTSIGLCFLPLEHKFHFGLSRPQKEGPSET